VTHRSDAGEITLGRLIGIGLVVVFACLLFLIVDVRHRMAGYQAVNGQGIRGTVSVAACESHRLGRLCTGNFVSSDGRVQRQDVRINGVKTAERQTVPAAIAGAEADEAWTTGGSPWTTPSVVLFAALIPVAMAVGMLWNLFAGGPSAWRAQGRAMRARHARDRDLAREREVRLGRVH
jgi:hypothetical protein